MTLDEMFREEEEKRAAQHLLETAAEKSAWDGLTEDERAAQIAVWDAKWDALADTCDTNEFEPFDDDDDRDIIGWEPEDDEDEKDSWGDYVHY